MREFICLESDCLIYTMISLERVNSYVMWERPLGEIPGEGNVCGSTKHSLPRRRFYFSRGARISSLPTNVGREEKRTPLKTPAWEAIQNTAVIKTPVSRMVLL